MYRRHSGTSSSPLPGPKPLRRYFYTSATLSNRRIRGFFYLKIRPMLQFPFISAVTWEGMYSTRSYGVEIWKKSRSVHVRKVYSHSFCTAPDGEPLSYFGSRHMKRLQLSASRDVDRLLPLVTHTGYEPKSFDCWLWSRGRAQGEVPAGEKKQPMNDLTDSWRGRELRAEDKLRSRWGRKVSWLWDRWGLRPQKGQEPRREGDHRSRRVNWLLPDCHRSSRTWSDRWLTRWEWVDNLRDRTFYHHR